MADGTFVKPGLKESCADTCCRPTPSALSLTSERPALIRQAFRLEWMTVAWMVVEGVVALAAGLAAGSLTLMAFGLDSAIELASAGVLIRRLNVELRHGKGFSERAERTASRIGAVLLFTLAAYIVAGAAWSLWTRQGEAFSLPGLIVALLAMPIMTLLARRKIAIATQLGSRLAGRCRREYHLRLAVARRSCRPVGRPHARRVVGRRRNLACDRRLRRQGSAQSLERRGLL
jgi:hypothetical protein